MPEASLFPTTSGGTVPKTRPAKRCGRGGGCRPHFSWSIAHAPDAHPVKARLSATLKLFWCDKPVMWRDSGRSGAITTSHRYKASLSWVLSPRSEEHTSELQSLMRISYAVFCLKKQNK